MHTNQSVAEKLGCDFTTVSRLRNGRRRPSFTMAAAIEVHFGIPLAEQAKALEESTSAFGRLFNERVFGGQPVDA